MISATRVLKALLISFLLAASAYGVSKLNLFGLEDASDRLADHVYQRVTAAEYGGPSRRGQQAVRIVYLDETSIEAMKGYGWTRFPPTFAHQWLMIDDLLNVGGAPPDALFVDFVYMGQGGPSEGFDQFLAGVAAATRADAWRARPGCLTDPMMKIGCIVEAGGVPILFAKPSPEDLDLFTDVQRQLDAVAVLTPALVHPEAYPATLAYDFAPAKARRLGVHGYDVSPALAMYAAYCLKQADACGLPAFRHLRGAARAAFAGRPARAPDMAAAFDAPIDVVWGSRPSPYYAELTERISGHRPDCRQDGGSFRRLLEQFVGQRGAGSGDRQECPYALSIGYDRMVAGVGLEGSDLERILAGKLVMVGGHFRASNDWAESPVHGQLPGVHLHAMALDNLIEYGAGYRRNGSALLDSDLIESALVFALAFWGVLAVMWRNSLLDRCEDAGLERRLKAAVYGPLYAILFTASLAAVGLATWVGVTAANRSPINWIGIGGVTLGFLFYATRQTLPADLCGTLERLPVIRRMLAFQRLCARSMKFEEDRLAAPPRPKPAAPSSPAPSTAPDPLKEAPVHAEA